jgi:hypothetical protein
MAADVKIDIAAEFTGKKAFKQAETSTDKLVKTTKKLAGALGLAFGAQQVIAFGRKSVKAFADSELEATRLTKAVSNLGLAFAAPEIDRYIDKVELATGVNRDLLQPSFLTLLQTTGSLTKSQELLNLSLDVAAGTGADVASVSTKLAQAYIGNAKGLRSLNLGLTTAELNSADFETIQKRITQLFGGQGEAAAASYVAQIAKLSIASEQASEIIGKGLVDSLIILSGNTSVEELADDMLDAARNTAAFTEAVANLANAINAPIKGLANVLTAFVQATDPFVDLIIEGDPSGFMTKKPPSSSSAPAAGFGGRTFYADAKKNAEAIAKAEATARKRAAELLAIKKKQQALEGKILKDKKLAALIDKSNALLSKGEEVFDMDKIQIAAALTNQAEQLGKATSGAQLLQIANDTARLNVKRSILALEDAIASKDEEAIIKATAKLNEDLKILGALTNQKTQMIAIESILKGLTPKDLINQNNLDEALRKIKEMLALLAQVKTPTITPPAGGGGGGGGGGGAFIKTPNGIRPTTDARSIEAINKANEDLGGVISVIGENGKEFIKLIDGLAPVFQSIEDSGAFNALVNSFAGGAIGSFDAGSFRAGEGGSLFNSGAVGSRDRDIVINVNTGVGDPNAIAEAIDEVLRQARDRGTLTAL